jgi:hypothetical protein
VADDTGEGDGIGAIGKKDSLFLSGWSLRALISSVQNRLYATSVFALQDADSISYSNYRVGIEVSRGATIYFMKVLPPVGNFTIHFLMLNLAITLMISLFVILLDVEATSSRIATAVGGLISEIFLQLSFSNLVPPSDYLTLLDWVFNICFVAILAVIVEVIIYYYLIFSALSSESFTTNC